MTDTTTPEPATSPVPAAATPLAATYAPVTSTPATITHQWADPSHPDTAAGKTPAKKGSLFGTYAVCMGGDNGESFVIALTSQRAVDHAADVASREGWTVTQLPDVRLVEARVAGAKRAPRLSAEQVQALAVIEAFVADAMAGTFDFADADAMAAVAAARLVGAPATS